FYEDHGVGAQVSVQCGAGSVFQDFDLLDVIGINASQTATGARRDGNSVDDKERLRVSRERGSAANLHREISFGVPPEPDTRHTVGQDLLDGGAGRAIAVGRVAYGIA